MAGLSGNMLQVHQPRGYGSMLSLEEKCEQSFFLFYYYRMEDEAVLDRGASFLKHVCDEEEVEGKIFHGFFFFYFQNVQIQYIRWPLKLWVLAYWPSL